jgi:hypothetical protein
MSKLLELIDGIKEITLADGSKIERDLFDECYFVTVDKLTNRAATMEVAAELMIEMRRHSIAVAHISQKEKKC